jgi:uncharacterized protein (TIGR01777 family)
MNIIISGASGLVGSALVPHLESRGHTVIRLVRPPREAAPGEIQWDPASGRLDPAALDGIDAVINLNGRSIGDSRWNTEVKNELRQSRLDATRTIASAIAASDHPPGNLINASAVGFYGDRGEQVLTEDSEPGTGFLAELSRSWEKAALAAASDKTRVSLLRLGMVIADGGALDKMLLPFKLGLGGPMGSGRQFWPWISIRDVVGAVDHILDREEVSGPVNLVAPEETRCSEFASTLGKVLRRPAFLPLPAFAARLTVGEMADALLLSSQRVHPGVLQETGYQFRDPTLAEALRSVLR